MAVPGLGKESGQEITELEELDETGLQETERDDLEAVPIAAVSDFKISEVLR